MSHKKILIIAASLANRHIIREYLVNNDIFQIVDLFKFTNIGNLVARIMNNGYSHVLIDGNLHLKYTADAHDNVVRRIRMSSKPKPTFYCIRSDMQIKSIPFIGSNFAEKIKSDMM